MSASTPVIVTFIVVITKTVNGLVLDTQQPAHSISVGTPSAHCSDRIDNCRLYNKTACLDPYSTWALNHCPQYCGFCKAPIPLPPCQDTLTNCYEYGSNICSKPDYQIWVEDHCRLFCRNCTDEQLSTIDAMTTTEASGAPSACQDKLPNCNEYQDNTCTESFFRHWALENCRKYCNLCTASTGANIRNVPLLVSDKMEGKSPVGKPSLLSRILGLII